MLGTLAPESLSILLNALILLVLLSPCLPAADSTFLTVPDLPSSPYHVGTGTPSCWASPGEYGVLSAAVIVEC